ncbi:MAG: hypothetical protein R3C11_11705 [Planctomycetaceae bacterium]
MNVNNPSTISVVDAGGSKQLKLNNVGLTGLSQAVVDGLNA